MLVHGLAKVAESHVRAAELFRLVGFDPDMLNRFQWGERQRIGIARALAAEPAFILCDAALV